MRVDSVDFFYLSMPQVTTEVDGSQDALVVRVRAGGLTGWGECEASPLTSIAAWACPMSHGACRPVSDSVLGETLDGPDDIARIARQVGTRSLDLLQAAHTFSGVEMALWDVLGKQLGQPVHRLLGYSRAHAKRPYASQLFGDTPAATLERARAARRDGFIAAKFGWGPFGHGSVAADRDQVMAAREGLGPDGILLVDAGQVWGEDVDAAAARLPVLEEARTTWLEEPFHGSAYAAYAALQGRSPRVRLAGGEASHSYAMADHLIGYGKVGFVQIDCGRIGGIGPAKAAADRALAAGITYVNHTFTSHLALSASLQPYAGLEKHELCEYPTALKSLAWDMTTQHLLPDANGMIVPPSGPGLGIDVAPAALRRYAVQTEIRIGGRILYSTPSCD